MKVKTLKKKKKKKNSILILNKIARFIKLTFKMRNYYGKYIPFQLKGG
jgi:hypothetical protein